MNRPRAIAELGFRMQTLEPGMIITCPLCENKIARTRVELKWGSPVCEADFEPLDPETAIVAFEPGQCKCGALYLIHGSIHTENGWWPK